ncbi:hypothetical protein AX16_006299 [Volvariella volvacea WC 439]|nr:hypothetical protein AX16_006299 [Volvariella volvacea WC 439]
MTTPKNNLDAILKKTTSSYFGSGSDDVQIVARAGGSAGTKTSKFKPATAARNPGTNGAESSHARTRRQLATFTTAGFKSESDVSAASNPTWPQNNNRAFNNTSSRQLTPSPPIEIIDSPPPSPLPHKRPSSDFAPDIPQCTTSSKRLKKGAEMTASNVKGISTPPSPTKASSSNSNHVPVLVLDDDMVLDSSGVTLRKKKFRPPPSAPLTPIINTLHNASASRVGNSPRASPVKESSKSRAISPLPHLPPPQFQRPQSVSPIVPDPPAAIPRAKAIPKHLSYREEPRGVRHGSSSTLASASASTSTMAFTSRQNIASDIQSSGQKSSISTAFSGTGNTQHQDSGSGVGPTALTSHHDLEMESDATLTSMLSQNIKLQRMVFDDISEHYASSTKIMDIDTLEKIRDILSDRIKEIEEVVKARRIARLAPETAPTSHSRQASPAPSRLRSGTPHIPEPSTSTLASTSTSHFFTGPSTSRDPVHRQSHRQDAIAIDKDEDIEEGEGEGDDDDDERDAIEVVDSDDQLWDGMGELPSFDEGVLGAAERSGMPDASSMSTSMWTSMSSKFIPTQTNTATFTSAATGCPAQSSSSLALVNAGNSLAQTQSLSDLTTAPQQVVPASNPYYREVMTKLNQVFKLTGFRPNQLEAITAALSGEDVFVLMPTGGGKSLCYQLPAVCQGGTTKGVTVVVSPLLALMKDQVDGLKKRGIDVFCWNGDTTHEEAMRKFYGGESLPQVMYVTPEKLKENASTKKVMGMLYREKKLARFVIDEAHCISTWGQDFREAYQDLGLLREQWPSVPVMALTATANERTIKDIIYRLNMNKPRLIQQSFNRPNLNYIVKDKRGATNDIINFIRTKHWQETGVIYCLGREKCEKVAKLLQMHGFQAAHFHAKMKPEEKDKALEEWKEGRCHIIVATIAFGMGIDKADVRFVIHHDVPKSLDGYYQETGRAGRDGKPADCVLYYSYADFNSIVKMLQNSDPKPTQEALERQTAAAREVVQFCSNVTQCRRQQLLQYFNELDPVACNNMCDNCANGIAPQTQNVTEEARLAVGLVQFFQDGKDVITATQCKNILRGARTAEIFDKGWDKLEPFYAKAAGLPAEILEQLISKLRVMDVLKEVSMPNASGFHTSYIQPGSQVFEFLCSGEPFMLEWRPKNPSKGAKKTTATKRKAGGTRGKGKQRLVEARRPLYEDEDVYVSDAD